MALTQVQNEMLLGPISGGGGAENLVTNGNAESASVSIFTAYADAAGTRPVDGTGGSPNVTTSLSTTNPINGLKDFRLIKDAANRQGQGWAVTPISIPLAYRAKSLKVSIKTLVTSGTFVPGSNGVDGDVIWYFYDITNSKLVEPSNIKILSNSTTISDVYEATVQFDYNTASVRLIAHVSTTSTSAYTIQVDDVTISPQNYVYGTPIIDEKSYTPAFTALGTVTNIDMVYSRRGDKLLARGRFTIGTPAASQARIGLPSGLVVKSGTQNSLVGTFARGGGSQNNKGGWLLGEDSKAYVTFTTADVIGSTSADPTSNADGTAVGNSGEVFFVNFEVPIEGWTSSVRTSDSFDSRNISFLAYKSGGNNNGSSGVISYSSKIDETGMFNLSTGEAIVNSAGDWDVGYNLEWSGAQTVGFAFRVNGVVTGTYSTSASSVYSMHGFILKNLKVGDVIIVSSSTGSTVNFVDFYFWMNKRQAPQTIAASEKINFSYTQNSGQTLTNSTDITLTYNNKISDTHGLYNTSTGEWVLPRKVRGEVKAAILTASVNPSAATYYEFSLFKNGVKYKAYNFLQEDFGATLYPFLANFRFQGVAGDIFEVVINHGLGTVAAYSGGGYEVYNYLDVDME